MRNVIKPIKAHQFSAPILFPDRIVDRKRSATANMHTGIETTVTTNPSPCSRASKISNAIVAGYLS